VPPIYNRNTEELKAFVYCAGKNNGKKAKISEYRSSSFVNFAKYQVT
jgi:hypothetical protein